MNGFKLKEGFLLGVATAATQIEGGETDNNWLDWYKKGNISDGSSPARANDHYNRYEEDISLMKSLDIEVCRFGIEWARIEPEDGAFDDAAIEHYRKEIKLMIKSGIQPLLTLHHFSNPMWFERKGGFENEENIPIFLRFVEKAVLSFGDLVSDYNTINEPNVYAMNGYFFGVWPPAKKSMAAAAKVMSVMTACHIKSYEIIHRVRSEMGFDDSNVSFANHVRAFVPKRKNNLWDRFCSSFSENFFQGAITKAMCTGVCSFPLKKIGSYQKGVYCDYIAVNYYTRSSVKGLSDSVKDNAPVNDLGWEIYPDGIVECAKKLYAVVKKPIYVTENGTCDASDSFRSRYVYEHLKAISESELPFERYYQWCFCDNFEWVEGESARFGIVYVDYETQKRTVKKSGEFYKKIILDKGVSEKLYDEYVKDQKYNYNN